MQSALPESGTGLLAADPPSAQAIAPVSLAERIDVVDILRGVAIFGMLVVNFSHDLDWSWRFTSLWPGTADRVAYFLLHFGAAEKFHGLFSFLFGWSFALQMGRAEARGVRFFPLYARRLFILFLIGLANLILLNWDATLVEYALSGFLLFLFRVRALKMVLIAALLFACYWPAHEAIIVHNHAQHLEDPRTLVATRQADTQEKAEQIASEEDDLRFSTHASFKDFVVQNTAEVADELSSGSFYLGLLGYPFPLLLLGLYVGRRRILQDVSAHIGFLRKVLGWGLILGLVGNAIGIWVSPYPGTYQAPWARSWIGDAAFHQVGVPALSFCYASAIVLLAQRPMWKVWLAPLAPVGRMALSNYILQIVIFDLLAYGLGFFGKFGPRLGALVGLIVFLLEVLLSTWWLRRFRFGPAEWLWRTLTYGKLQPMHVPPRVDARGDAGRRRVAEGSSRPFPPI